MKTADECRKLTQTYHAQADQPRVSPKMAVALRSIAHTFNALAEQHEIMLAIAEEECERALQRH